MAIEMIEKSELMATSRLGGMKRFVDDKYYNYTGGEDFFELFGSRRRKKSAARQQVVDKYKNVNENDCASVLSAIEVVSNDLATLVKRSASTSKKLEVREQIDETNIILGELKAQQIKLGCEKLQKQEEEVKSKQETLQLLQNLGESQIEKTKTDIATASGGVLGLGSPSDAGGTASPTQKYLLYGGIGLAAIILIAVVVKMRKK